MGKTLNTTLIITSLLIGSFFFVPSTVSQTQNENEFEADKGPDTIDVSDYPAEMQDYYKIFSKRCSKCHTLARPINTDFPIDKWERYVKRMMRKPGSGITKETGKKIFSFLKYYAEHKK